jgi:hypothetical protein
MIIWRGVLKASGILMGTTLLLPLASAETNTTLVLRLGDNAPQEIILECSRAGVSPIVSSYGANGLSAICP